MILDVWCFNCGYPLKLKRLRDEGGEHLTFYDRKTGRVVKDCPRCLNWPLSIYGIESKPSMDAMFQREAADAFQVVITAIGRHPAAEDDPAVIDAINDVGCCPGRGAKMPDIIAELRCAQAELGSASNALVATLDIARLHGLVSHARQGEVQDVIGEVDDAYMKLNATIRGIGLDAKRAGEPT